MCGRYTLTRMKGVGRMFGDPQGLPRWNVAPTQMVLVRTNQSQQAELFRWGLIPHWAKDEKIGYSLINARCETVVEKPTFREAMAKRRCLVAADGFYEWRKNADGSKTPMYIHRSDGEPFAFAGLWETWRNAAGELVRTCSIVTTTANSLMAPIHERMPVILAEADCEKWLRSDEVAAAEAARLLVPCAVEGWEAFPVSTRVNNVRNDGAELVALADAAPPAEVKTSKSKKKKEDDAQGSLFG